MSQKPTELALRTVMLHDIYMPDFQPYYHTEQFKKIQLSVVNASILTYRNVGWNLNALSLPFLVGKKSKMHICSMAHGK